LLGLVGFLGSIPIFLFSIFGGVLADRMNKKNILIVTQVSFMFLAFLLALFTQFKLITPTQIMFIALANGIIMAFDAPARQSIVVEMVGKDNLFNAIALNSVAFNSSRIIGPAIGGLLISAVGMSGCFYLNGLSFCAVIAALLWIKVKQSRVSLGSSAIRDFKIILVFVRTRRMILGLLSMVAAVSLFGISYVILMPVFASEVLHAQVKGLGILMSGTGLGALAGALILARLGNFQHKGRLLVYAVFLFSASLVIFSLSRGYFLSLFSLVFVGSSSVIAISLVNTLLQTNVPDRLRGRMMSLFMVTFAGITPFGNLIAGILAQYFGVSLALLICGCICGGLFFVINMFFKEIKEL
jgi:predicted MFS family arabinose efflux permease